MNVEPDPDETSVFTLHRYFIWANKLRDHLGAVLEQQGPMPDTHPGMSTSEREATELNARAWLLPVFFYGGYWLASLYVVIEGWQELRLRDEKVDQLLEPEFVSRLRRNRNAILHFQRNYLDPRVEDFVAGSILEGPGRARELHEALSEYFLRWFEQRRRRHDV